MVEAKFMHFFSLKDKNHVMASRVYFVVIKEIWDIEYVLFKMPLFKCKWIGNNIGVQTVELGFIRVDFGKKTYMT